MAQSNEVVAFKSKSASTPSTVNGVIRPNRVANDQLRDRKHLTLDEVEAIRNAAKRTRYGDRDSLMVLMGFRHALRVSELCNLKWSDVDLKKAATLYVRRLKGSDDSTHPLQGDEVRALRILKAKSESAFIFNTMRGGPIAAASFRKTFAKWGEQAKIPFPINPHMLRHACGYYLANKGVDTRTLQAYLGHANIQHTVAYTALDAGRFKSLWD